mmetsp:Transcript_81024/g.211412  ORF Transcript_81024/g.211412 Transcript_81024/m.211412 type:complete len:279 (+) Transcript_81024:845-1681(+)
MVEARRRQQAGPREFRWSACRAFPRGVSSQGLALQGVPQGLAPEDAHGLQLPGALGQGRRGHQNLQARSRQAGERVAALRHELGGLFEGMEQLPRHVARQARLHLWALEHFPLRRGALGRQVRRARYRGAAAGGPEVLRLRRLPAPLLHHRGQAQGHGDQGRGAALVVAGAQQREHARARYRAALPGRRPELPQGAVADSGAVPRVLASGISWQSALRLAPRRWRAGHPRHDRCARFGRGLGVERQRGDGLLGALLRLTSPVCLDMLLCMPRHAAVDA